jgi:hypothetical protein
MKKNIVIFIFALSSIISFPSHAQLSLRGVIDFDLPTAGSTGKALHLRADSAIQDLSQFAIGVANNGGGTDGIEYVFPSLSLSLGDDIILYRDSAAITNYFQSCFSNFEIKLQASNSISQNGDDAIELFKDSVVIETFGDINIDGTGTSWEYTDSWAYKDTLGAFWPNGWIYGGPNCTDNDTLVSTSSCPYPECSNNSVHVVTFRVNTANITVGPNGIYAGGGVIGGADAVALSDPDGDGIWEGTDTLDGTAGGNFIFLNSPNNSNDWGTKESLAGLPCSDPANYDDRILPTFTQDTTLEFCFGTCSPNTVCPAPAVQQNIHFVVDMNSPKAPASWTQPYVSGNFNSWSGDAMPMTDADGDNVWEYTAMIDQNTALEYKFTLDNWANQEQFVASTSDSLCTQDFGGFVNRVYTVGTADDTLDFCFNYCESNCTSVGFGEDNLEFMVMPNPANNMLNISSPMVDAQVDLISISGERIMSSLIKDGECEINTSNMANGFYLIRVSSLGNVSVKKVLIRH